MGKIFKKEKSIVIFIILVLFSTFGFLSVSLAQPHLETNWPTAPGGKTLNATSSLVDFVEYSYRWAILLGGLVAFFALVYAGFKYLTSVGDPNKMKDAKDRIISAILGLVLLLSTFLILSTLNPELTTLRAPTTTVGGFSPGKLGGGPSNEPCKMIQFFKGRNFNKLYAAYADTSLPEYANYWNPAAGGIEDCTLGGCAGDEPPCAGDSCAYRLKIDKCLQVGATGWALVGWFEDEVPINSVKILGGCVVNIYSENDCTGSYNTFSMTDANIGGYAQKQKHSIKIIDKAPPGKPETRVDHGHAIVSNGAWNAVEGYCEADLEIWLQDMRKNGFVTLYALFGENDWKFDYLYPDPDNYPPGLPGGHEIPIVTDKVGYFTYRISHLQPNSTYWFKVKGVGDGGKACICEEKSTSSYSFTLGPGGSGCNVTNVDTPPIQPDPCCPN